MNLLLQYPTQQSSRDGITVGIVDDNESFRTAATRILERAGFSVRAFGGVREFLDSGAWKRLRCLVLDVRMPGIDGFALQDCLRSTNYDVPVIFCSGSSSKRAQAQALAAGAVAYLRKPVNPQELLQVVYSVCGIAEAPVEQPIQTLAG